MKPFSYRGQIITAETKQDAIAQIVISAKGNWVAHFNNWNHNNKLYKQFCSDFKKFFNGDIDVEIGMGGGFGGGYYSHSIYFNASGTFEKALKKKKLFDKFMDDTSGSGTDGVVNVTNEDTNQMQFIIYVNAKRSVIKVDGNKNWWKQLKANPKFANLLKHLKNVLNKYYKKIEEA